MNYFMGIDLGTSSVKVLVADEHGKTKGIGQCGYEVLVPEVGWAEQDPQEWWCCTKQAISQAIGNSGVRGEEIRGIGFSGQMHGVVALDDEGKPIHMALIHLDQRSLLEKQEIYEQASELLSEELLNQPSAGMLICSLLWMKHQKPVLYEKIRYVMSPKDYIRYLLTGVICTDYSDAAATLAFSVRNRRWCMELIKRLGLKTDIWPSVQEAGEVAGTVTSSAAVETGLAQGTKVVTGAGDCAAAMIGNAVVEEGIVTCNIGTASQIAVITAKPVYDEGMQCQLWCHAIPEMWFYQGGALNGGNTLSWLRNKVLKAQTPFKELDQEAARVPAGSEGLMFLPYLAGERTPFNDPQARGAYFGLGMKHDQAYMVRATMEGVMYNLKECKKIFDRMQIPQKKLIASGGGSKGNTWKQIQADMLGMPVYTTKTEEEACLGAAILAAVGTGSYSSVYEACREIVQLDERVTEPIAEHVKYYQEKQEVFCKLYQQVKELYKNI